MSSTIVHMGFQGFVTRRGWPRAELLWIFLGGWIPDAGWILQRALRRLPMDLDPFLVLSYSLILSSLVACLWLCLSIALVTRRPGRTFAILGLSALFHLVLDALEVKWSSGVLLGAPFTWQAFRAPLFPLDGVTAWALLVVSLAWVLVHWREGVREIVAIERRPVRLGVWAPSLGFLVLYLVWPLLWLQAPARENLYDIATLREREERAGRRVELDRARYRAAEGGVRIFSGETILTPGLDVPDGALISVRGVFASPSVLSVSQHQVHHPWVRDFGSYLGLFLLGGFMVHGFWRRWHGGSGIVPNSDEGEAAA